MGREDEFALDGLGDASVEEIASRITSLSPVHYGRSREMLEALDIRALTGQDIGIRFVDLNRYAGLNIFGSGQSAVSKGRKGGIFINQHKTIKADPDNVYLAISKDIDDTTLIHQLAHVLDYLGGSRLMPGTLEPLAFELRIPVEHLEHPEEFGYWLIHLQQKFQVTFDADDAIVSYLYQNQMLIKGEEIQRKNRLILRSKSDRILRFLSERSAEIDRLIRNRPGYIGIRSPAHPNSSGEGSVRFKSNGTFSE
ncbi:MAG: hypothetical protein KKE57_00440 [Proteobacteria bacterium]|nr:hypothetical protein [Pseudomonadota bacterium]